MMEGPLWHPRRVSVSHRLLQIQWLECSRKRILRHIEILRKRAMKISNDANVVLLVFKIHATIKSGSIAIAAAGDIIISAAIMATLVLLVAQSAAPAAPGVLQKLTYLVIRHPQVKGVDDDVQAYTFGERNSYHRRDLADKN